MALVFLDKEIKEKKNARCNARLFAMAGQSMCPATSLKFKTDGWARVEIDQSHLFSRQYIMSII